MVVIRLSRGGSKARPFYNIVAADKRVRRDGAFIERLGFYNPNARGAEEGLRVALDQASHQGCGLIKPAFGHGFRWQVRRSPFFIGLPFLTLP